MLDQNAHSIIARTYAQHMLSLAIKSQQSLVTRAVRQDKRDMLGRTVLSIQQAAEDNDSHRLFQLVRRLRPYSQSAPAALKDEKGNMASDSVAI
eukprot:3322230-Alexandrium_andersonii.AAC.1